MNKACNEEKRKKIREAIVFFRKLAEKNKSWDGTAEINKWRDMRK